MQMRKFTFTDNAAGRTDFSIIYQSVRGIDPEKITKDERPYVAAALRVLDRISEPIGDLPPDADDYTIDARMRRLTSGDDRIIDVSAKLHEKIANWIDSTKFQAGASVAVEDAVDRWAQAEKFDKSDTAEPTIGIVRKRKGH